MKATEVTAGLAESNGSLLPGLWRYSLHVTCGLTARTPGSARGPTLGNECGKTLPLQRQTNEQRARKYRRTECVDGGGDRAGKADAVRVVSSHEEHVGRARLKVSHDVRRLRDVVGRHDPALPRTQHRHISGPIYKIS